MGTFWHIDCVQKLSLNAFTERYLKFCRKHGYNFSEEKVAELYRHPCGFAAMSEYWRKNSGSK